MIFIGLVFIWALFGHGFILVWEKDDFNGTTPNKTRTKPEQKQA
jgi:hypothetical protein